MLFEILYSSILIFLLQRVGFFRLPKGKDWKLIGVLLVKFSFAIVLFHFPYDTMRDSGIYLNDSLVLSNVFLSNPKDFFSLFMSLGDTHELDWKHMKETLYWSHEQSGLLSEKRNTIRANTLLQLISLQHSYLVFLWNALIALLGLKLIYQSALKFVLDKYHVFFFLIFLLPSTLLWTSNLMKENFMVLGLGLYFCGLIRQKSNSWLYALSGILLLLMFKQYVGIAFGMGYILFTILTLKNAQLRLAILGFSAVLLVLGLIRFAKPITNKISEKQADFIRLAEGGIVLNDLGQIYRIDISEREKFQFFIGEEKNEYGIIKASVSAAKIKMNGTEEHITLKPSDKHWYVVVNAEASGSRIDVTPIQNSPMKLVKNIPEALINVLLRPFPTDPPKSIMKWYFVLENALLVGLMLTAFAKWKNFKNKNLILSILFSALLVSLFIGWTTPVLGAIVRYKLPVVLSLILVSWLLLQPKHQPEEN